MAAGWPLVQISSERLMFTSLIPAAFVTLSQTAKEPFTGSRGNPDHRGWQFRVTTDLSAFGT
jgi:hypothetical protein